MISDELMMTQIVEEEDDKCDLMFEHIYQANKEGLPSHIIRNFQAHEKEGAIIQFSPCGKLMYTVGGCELKSWKEEFLGAEYKLQLKSKAFPKPVNLLEVSPTTKHLSVSSLD